jgi:osmotically-inducible protein OsmY
MNYHHSRRGMAVLVMLTAALSACAASNEYSKCGPAEWRADAQITSEVQRSLNKQLQLQGGEQVEAGTVNGVVYLTGRVLLDAESDSAQSIAGQTPGVRHVVNMLYVESWPARFALTRRGGMDLLAE